MNWLKQSTAVTLKLGPFLDSTDGDTEETGLTIAYTDVMLSKNGGTIAAKSDTTGATHDADGWYGVPLNTTDTGTLGRLKVYIHVSGALAVWEEYLIVPANVYDSLVLGTDYLQGDTIQIEGSDATDQINAACDTAISDAALATAANLQTVDNNVDSVLADTDELQANQGNWLTATGFSTHSAADVWTVTTRTLSSFGTLVSDIVTAVWSAGTRTLTSFGSLIADMWTNVTRTVTGGTIDTNNDMRGTDGAVTSLAGVATEAKQDVIDGNVDSILEDTGTTIPATLSTIDGIVDDILVDTGTTIPNQISALNDLSAAEIRAAIGLAAADLDEQLATLSTFDPEADILENSKSYADMFRIMKAVLAGKSTGAGLVFRDDADAKDRVTVTIDEDKNRTAVTLDGE